MMQALQSQDSLGDQAGRSRTHYHLARYHLALNDSSQARWHARESLNDALASSNHKRQLASLQLLTRLEPGAAAAHSRDYLQLLDSLTREERLYRDKFARIQFQTSEYIEQNELLARQRQLWIGIAAATLLVAALVFVVIMQRQRNQKLRFEQQQQQANQEIFDLMLSQRQKLEEGKQGEQKRISEELHDGVLGALNGIRMVLLGLNKKNDDQAVGLRSDALEKLKDVQEEIRTISHELNDASYQKFHNFVLSLKELLEQTSNGSGLSYDFHYDEDVHWDDLSGDLKINLYRCAQECLQNSVKHGKAKRVGLVLAGDSTEVRMEVSDDGRGFRLQKGKRGIGHKNIASRIGRLGGQWTIESEPGQGTRVKVQVPVAHIRKNGTHTVVPQVN